MTPWYLGTLENCGRTVFKIVLPTDDFETIKNGITLIARLLQYFPYYLLMQIIHRESFIEK